VSPFSLPSLIAFAINISLVIIVVLDNPKSHAHRLFGLVILCFALWNVADIIVINSSTREIAAIGTMIIVVVFLFASTFFLLLSFSFPLSIHSRFDRFPARLLFLVLPLIFSFLSGIQIFQPIVLQRFDGIHVNFYFVNIFGGVLNGALYATVFAHIVWGIRNLLIQLHASTERTQRVQIIFVLFGTIGFALLLISLNVGREYHNIYFFASRALFVSISLFFAFVVLGNRILILRRIGKQGIAYSTVTALVFGFYLIIIKNITEVIGERFKMTSLVFDILVIIILSFIFRPLVNRVESLIEHIFSQNIFRYRQKFIRFSREAFQLSSMTDFTQAVTVFLKEALMLSRAEILIDPDGSGQFRGVNNSQNILLNDGAISVFSASEQKLYEVKDVLQKCSVVNRQYLQNYDGGYIIPLHADKGIMGILVTGPTASGKDYTNEETEFLTIFSNSISVVVERNVLMEKVRSDEIRAAQMEKLAALGRLTAGIAHEFRNPLNIIATSAQTILRNPDAVDIHRETGKYILEETNRLSDTVDAFLQFAKPHSPIWETVHLEEIFNNVIRSLQSRSIEKNITIVKNISSSLKEIVTSPHHLERSVTNLGLNAIEAMSNNGTLTMIAQQKNENAIIIEIRDTGPGIPLEYHNKIFDPFFTTKKTGTGLGLSIVYMMVHSMKGIVTFTSDNTGTIFIIELPIDGSKR
jgi:signal transduction histidine kinase